MKTIHLYLVKEILTYFLIAVLVFTVVFMMGKTLKLTELLVNKGVSPFDIGKLLIYFLPSSLIFIFPIAMLSGVLIAFVRPSSDNEIVAFKASGVSLYQLTPPVLFLSVTAYLPDAYLITPATLPIHRADSTKELLFFFPHRNIPLQPVKIHSHKNCLAFLFTPPIFFSKWEICQS